MVALYPGSFDPFTLGHQVIVNKSLGLFDKIIVAVGTNTKKSGYFSVEKRLELIAKVFKADPRVEIVSYSELTYEFCRKHDIRYVVRGLRNIHDFEFEREIAYINQMFNRELETIFLLTPSDHTVISSSVVREILSFGGDPMSFMPKELSLEDLTR